MYISKVSLVNYRNFKSSNLSFKKGINTIISENGSGKTNLFKAVRLLLDNGIVVLLLQVKSRRFQQKT